MTPRHGTKCPECPKIIYGGASQWDAHARTHTYLAADRRRWVTATPWWMWTFQLVNPDPGAPALWLERTPADWPGGVKSTYVAHRVIGGAVDSEEALVLAAAGLKEAKKEAAALFDVTDWRPMLSLQMLSLQSRRAA